VPINLHIHSTISFKCLNLGIEYSLYGPSTGNLVEEKLTVSSVDLINAHSRLLFCTFSWTKMKLLLEILNKIAAIVSMMW